MRSNKQYENFSDIKAFEDEFDVFYLPKARVIGKEVRNGGAIGNTAPADTPVPEGFVYRDIPETICAKGLYGEGMSETIEKIHKYGYVTNWEPYGWNAELYLPEEEENPPKQVDTPWHWIEPIRKEEVQINSED